RPGGFPKNGLFIFPPPYLRDTRQVMVIGARRFLGLTIPPLKHFGPLLVVWGAAMLMLILIKDLGSSIMFFGAFLSLIYVATNRFSFVLVGLVMFGLGAWVRGSHIEDVETRGEIWQDPVKPGLVDNKGYQIAQSLFAQADGGVPGQGFGQARLRIPGG